MCPSGELLSLIYWNHKELTPRVKVSNKSDAIKIACDFVSIENLVETVRLVGEFREHRLACDWGDDVLQLYASLWYAWVSLSEMFASDSDISVQLQARAISLEVADESTSPLSSGVQPTALLADHAVSSIPTSPTCSQLMVGDRDDTVEAAPRQEPSSISSPGLPSAPMLDVEMGEMQDTENFASSSHKFLSKSPFQSLTSVPSRCILMGGLRPGTSVEYVAKILREHRGCGICITGSAPYPPNDGTSYVIECPDPHCSRILQAVWNNVEIDSQILWVSCMSVSDLHGINISFYLRQPYHTLSHTSSSSGPPQNSESFHQLDGRGPRRPRN